MRSAKPENHLKAGFHQRLSRSRILSPYDLLVVKIKNWSRKWNHKRDGIEVKNQNVSIFFRLHLRLCRLRSAYDPVKTRLSESEAEAEG